MLSSTLFFLALRHDRGILSFLLLPVSGFDSLLQVGAFTPVEDKVGESETVCEDDAIVVLPGMMSGSLKLTFFPLCLFKGVTATGLELGLGKSGHDCCIHKRSS